MATHPSKQSDPREDSPAAEDIVPPTPDEAGPHDVPDDQVIEQTLPTKRDGSDSPR
jgi:hypothetical protein